MPIPRRLSPDGWTQVAFGDVVRLCRERSADPVTEGYERFVGLEHIDPNNLRIRRWGRVAEGSTFTSVFRSGQTLFGKRRAYQGKVAVADFDGVCSSDIYVFESKDAKLLPGLLPFLCQTEGFLDHAIGTSAGSLSPRTKWESLAKYQFALPPMEDQRRTASLLLNVDALMASLVRTRVRAHTLRLAHLSHFFGSKSEQVQRLPDVARIMSGNTPSKSNPAFWGGQHPWATAKDLKTRHLTDTGDRLTDAGWGEATVAPLGATLIVVRGMILAHTFPVARCEQPIAINQDLRALVATEAIVSDFLLLWTEWMAPHFLSRMSQSTHGTKRLEARVLEAAPIPVPTRSEQIDFITLQEKLVEVVASINRRIAGAVELKRAFMRGLLAE